MPNAVTHSDDGGIRFLLDGKVDDGRCGRAHESVLNFLREDLRRTGTKEGCAEGDCGACTVVVGELAAASRVDAENRQRLHPVRAGARRQGAVHRRGPAAAERRVCTRCSRRWSTATARNAASARPGFVMSLWALYLEHQAARHAGPRGRRFARALTGNLCRCTGYRPILDAGERMFDLPRAPFDREALRRAAAKRCARRRRSPTSTAAAASSRRGRSQELARAARRASAGDASSPATPTSACGSTKQLRDLAGHHLHRRGRRAQGDRARATACSASAPARRSTDAYARAGAALSRADRDVGALRLAADPQRRDDGRQRRQRLADRRLDAGADRARRDASCCATASASRTLPLEDLYVGYMKKAMAAGRDSSQAIEVPLPTPGAALPHLQALEALRLRHLGRLRGVRDRARRRPASRAAASPSAAWRRRRSARRDAKPRSSAQPWNEATARAAHGGARRRLHAAHRHAGERRLPPAGRAEPAVPVLSRDAARPIRCRPTRGQRVRGRVGSATEPRVNRQAEALHRRGSATRRRGAASPHPHESAHLHVAGEARLRRRHPRARRHAARGARPVDEGARAASGRSTSRAVRAPPGVVAVLTAADIPGAERLRPDHPRRSDPRRRRSSSTSASRCSRWSPTPTTRRGAPRAQAKRRLRRPLPPVLTPQEAKRQQSYVLPPMHLVRGDAGDGDGRARRAGCAASSTSAARSSSTSRGRSPTRCRRRTAACTSTARRSIRPRCSTSSRTRSASSRNQVHGRVPAHGRRLRRQGVAVGALRLRRRGRGAAAAAAGEAAPRPRRRLHDHRQAPLLPLRVRGRLRRRRP